MEWFVYKHSSKGRLKTGKCHLIKQSTDGDKWVKEAWCGRQVHYMMGSTEYMLNPHWTEKMRVNDAGVCKDCLTKYRGKF